MADSTTPKPTPADFPSLDALLTCTTSAASPLAVALSGGADSTAMLVACALRWPHQVHAIHINHGLQAAATQFEQHCIALCEQWQVPLAIARVQAGAASGESPEEVARVARYKALSDIAQTHWSEPIHDIVLAQHADDQIETLLLALSRGAGLPGLASMPAQFERAGVRYHRPWLQVPGKLLRDTLTRLQISWIEDPTNQDTQFTRNRIRHLVLPALETAFPSFRQTFARSAAHAAQAQVLLQALAHIDAQQVGDPPHIKALQQLSPERQINVLRHWLASQDMQASAAQMQALVVQVNACTTRGHQIDLKVGRGFVRRDAAVLRCYNL